MTHLVKHVRQSAVFLISFYHENEYGVLRGSSRQANHQEQDVTIFQITFLLVFIQNSAASSLSHTASSSPLYSHHFFAGGFNLYLMERRTEANHFHSIHNKRRPTNIVNLLFIMNLVHYPINKGYKH